jgi:WD40 repeat protein
MIGVQSNEDITVLTYPGMDVVYAFPRVDDGFGVISVAPDGASIVHDLRSVVVHDGQGRFLMEEVFHEIHAASFSVDQESLVIAASSGIGPVRIIVHNLRAHEITSTIELNTTRSFNSGAFSHGADRLVLGFQNGIVVYDVQTGDLIQEFVYDPDHTQTNVFLVSHVMFSMDGTLTLTRMSGRVICSDTRTRETWELGTVLRMSPVSNDFVHVIKMNENGYRNLVYSLTTRELLQDVNEHHIRSYFSPYKEIIRVRGKTLTVQNIDSHEITVLESPVNVHTMVFSPAETVVLM